MSCGAAEVTILGLGWPLRKFFNQVVVGNRTHAD